jgi:hypothetical protein
MSDAQWAPWDERSGMSVRFLSSTRGVPFGFRMEIFLWGGVLVMVVELLSMSIGFDM